MQYLLTAWKKIKPLMEAHVLLLFLDYDGTLTPIVKHPRLARLSPAGRKVLRDLVLTKELKTAIVSGRSLAELKNMIGVKGLIYVGNHGLELEGLGLRFTHPDALRTKKLIRSIRRQLDTAFKSFPKIFVEDKTFTLSVHYREVPLKKVEQARDILLKVLGPYFRSSTVHMSEGKKVWEIRPLRWNKGAVILWLYRRVLARTAADKVLPIYVGDDQTDEDGFKALKRKGLSIKVMEDPREETQADCFVRSPEEVLKFLKRLCVLKERRKSHGTVSFLHSGSSSRTDRP